MRLRPNPPGLWPLARGAILSVLGSSGGHFGRLGANLSQHKAILSHLGANLRPPGANIAPTWAKMSQHGAPKPSWKALKRCAWHRGATAKPQLSHNSATFGRKTTPGGDYRGGRVTTIVITINASQLINQLRSLYCDLTTPRARGPANFCICLYIFIYVLCVFFFSYKIDS